MNIVLKLSDLVIFHITHNTKGLMKYSTTMTCGGIFVAMHSTDTIALDGIVLVVGDGNCIPLNDITNMGELEQFIEDTNK